MQMKLCTEMYTYNKDAIQRSSQIPSKATQRLQSLSYIPRMYLSLCSRQIVLDRCSCQLTEYSSSGWTESHIVTKQAKTKPLNLKKKKLGVKEICLTTMHAYLKTSKQVDRVQYMVYIDIIYTYTYMPLGIKYGPKV